MEPAWLPGLVLAVVSSLILLLFLITLLLARLPTLQKWLSPVLVKIAPAHRHHHSGGNPPSNGPVATASEGGSDVAGTSMYQQHHHHHHYGQHQSGGGSRSRPSRPSSLPCLPEEKMAYYQHPSYSSTASAGSTSLLASAAASAASTVAQAAAMPHRPHSFYPPIQQLEEDDCDEDDEDVLVSMVPVSSSTQHHHHQPHQRGRQGQRKLNLALHSDGSEASNSSSSASAANDPTEPGHHQRSRHRSSEEVAATASGTGMGLRQRPGNHHRHHGRDNSITTPTNASASKQQQHRRHPHIDDDIQRMDDWTSRTVPGAHHPPPVQRQSSIIETDCDKNRTLKATRGLSRSLAALTTTGLGRIRSMMSLGPSSHSESMMDMTDMSSTFGESESVLGGSVLNMASSRMSMITLPSSVNCVDKPALELGLTYSPAAGKVAIRLIELRQLNAAGSPGSAGFNRNTSFQLRLLLLPERKQRHKTKLRYVSESGTTAPIGETFIFSRIEPGELSSMGIRFRLYCSERLRRERLLGESLAGLKSLALDQLHREQQLIIQFDPPTGPFKKSLSALGRSTSSSSSRGDVSPTSMTGSSVEQQWQSEMIPPRHGIPELLLGLAYNGTTGRLSVEILRAASLRSWTSSRTPDVCVKLLLLTQTGQEIGRAKTTVKKGQDGPTWLETFSFQVTLFQLADVTLLISVVNKRSLKRKELIGWISLGFDSSVQQQTDHWQEMREAVGEQVCHWHPLLSP